MRTEMDDPLVLESLLAVRAWKIKAAVLNNGVFENSPASDSMKVTRQVVAIETSTPAVIHNPVGDDVSNPEDGARSEAAQVEKLALAPTPSQVGIASEVPFENSSFSSPNSGNFNDIAGRGAVVAQMKRRIRRKNWGRKDTDELLEAVLNTPKVSIRMEQGTDSDSYWDAVGKAVPGRTGDECRGRTDTLKKSFSTTKKYCDEQGKEFKQLSEKDFFEMKVSPRLTEAWYNQIRDYCPPRPKKKLTSNGAGNSSKSLHSPVWGKSSSVVQAALNEVRAPLLKESFPRVSRMRPRDVRYRRSHCNEQTKQTALFKASGPVTLPMEDTPACLEFQVADQCFQQQAPPVPQSADVAEDFIEDLFQTDLDPLQQQAPPVLQDADVAEGFIEDLFASFELESYPWV